MSMEGYTYIVFTCMVLYEILGRSSGSVELFDIAEPRYVMSRAAPRRAGTSCCYLFTHYIILLPSRVCHPG